MSEFASKNIEQTKHTIRSEKVKLRAMKSLLTDEGHSKQKDHHDVRLVYQFRVLYKVSGCNEQDDYGAYQKQEHECRIYDKISTVI